MRGPLRGLHRLLLPLSALLLLWPGRARADEVGHFIIGVGGSIGVELNGPKLIVGWAWDRAQLTLGLYGGALVLPPGPGAGVELGAEWIAMPTTPVTLHFVQNQPTVSAVLGAHLGAKFASLSHPDFRLEGIGQYRNTEGGLTYGFVDFGFPQFAEVGLGQRQVIANNMGPYLEGRIGYPMALNAELGVTSVAER